MADLREDFVSYVVKALVNNPDAVELTRAEDDKGEYLQLKVDPSDMGKVIGKAGATAKSLRTLLRGVGAKDNLAPLPLKIIDPEGRIESQPDAKTEPAPAEEPAPAKDEPKDEHAELHERTKREAQELADFDI